MKQAYRLVLSHSREVPRPAWIADQLVCSGRRSAITPVFWRDFWEMQITATSSFSAGYPPNRAAARSEDFVMTMQLRFLMKCLCIATGPGFATVAAAQVPPVASGPIKVLIRYPTMHGNSVVFEAGGNLWKTPLSGGTATQLTADSGSDMAPHFSPDGRWIAFTDWYQGNTDVYVIPADGGPVKRLTYHSINTPDRQGQAATDPGQPRDEVDAGQQKRRLPVPSQQLQCDVDHARLYRAGRRRVAHAVAIAMDRPAVAQRQRPRGRLQQA